MASKLRISKRDLKTLPKWQQEAEWSKDLKKQQPGKTLDQYFKKSK